MTSRRVRRRRFLAGTAAASAGLVAAPFVRGAYAAGQVSIFFWDHWVPAGNVEMINDFPVITLDTAIAEGLLYYVPEPKSPHGVDVTPDGEFMIVAGKLVSAPLLLVPPLSCTRKTMVGAGDWLALAFNGGTKASWRF